MSDGAGTGDATAPSPSPVHPPSPLPLQVLYEDHHLLIVNKPAPLLTQAPPGVPSLESVAKAYIKAKYAKPAGVYLGIPHRLDRPVSGVVCFTRNTKAAQRVHAQFAERDVRKVYWALVEGAVAPDAGVWDDWVRKLPEESRVERADEGEPGAKLATLEYRVLRRGRGPQGEPRAGSPSQTACTLVELAPLTGRMHQLRVQAAWRGHPVLGDAQYGGTRPFGPPAELSRDRVIALHARRLTLAHPFTKQELTVEAPLPDYWQALPAE
ncbi:MAG: RluA family pseudouridine synthase [Planctomycetes bacterium]|nr:RluA family pseudouridine synthase [Planctomycetota bacterium]